MGDELLKYCDRCLGREFGGLVVKPGAGATTLQCCQGLGQMVESKVAIRPFENLSLKAYIALPSSKYLSEDPCSVWSFTMWKDHG